MPRKAAVGFDEIFDVVKNLNVFDENNNLLSKQHPIWRIAKKNLKNRIEIHNLHQFIHHNRGPGQGIKTRLLNFKFGNCQAEVSYPKDNTANECSEENVADQYDCLLEMCLESVEYHNVITSIVARKFSVIYRLPEQIDLSKELCRITNSSGIILILNDLIQKVNIRNYISGNVFTIIFAARLSDTTVNIMQTISETLTFQYLTKFFKTMLQEILLSDRLVLTYSKLLLNSASFALNCCSFAELNLHYFKFLEKKIDYLPSIIIQVDLFSILIVLEQKILTLNRKLSAPVEDFFKKSIIYLSFVNNMEEFLKFIQHFLIVILSPYENRTTKKAITYARSKLSNDLISSNLKVFSSYLNKNESSMIYSHLNVSDDSSYILSDEKSSSIKSFITSLKEKAIEILKSDQSSSIANAFYSPTLFDQFFECLFEDFLSWTDILDPNPIVFVAAAKDHLATIIQDREIPLSVSEFIQFHIKDTKIIAQNTRDILHQIKNSKKPRKKISRIREVDHTALKEEENWKNKNKNTKTVAESHEETQNNETLKSNQIYSGIPSIFDERCKNLINSNSKDAHERNDEYNSFLNSTIHSDFEDDNQIKCSTINENFSERVEPDIQINSNANTKLSLSDHNYAAAKATSEDFSFSLKNYSYCKRDSDTVSDDTHLDPIQSQVVPFEPSAESISLDPTFENHISYNPETSNDLHTNTSVSSSFFNNLRPHHNNTVKIVDEGPPVKRSKGQYVTPAVLKTHHEQATTKNQRGPKDLFIKNGVGLKKGTIINKQVYRCDDTSIMDAITEIFSFASKYINGFSCKLSCTCAKDLCFFKIILNLNQARSLQNFYKSRAVFFYNYGQIENHLLKCVETCAEYYKKMFGSHYMRLESVFCPSCEKFNEMYTYTLKIFLGEKYFDESKVEEEIKKNLFRTVNCEDCNMSIEPDCTLGNYLILDVQHIESSTLLSMVPKMLMVKGKSFILTGLVSYEKEKSSTTYVAYIRKTSGAWTKRKSIKTKVVAISKMPYVTIAVIVYVNID